MKEARPSPLRLLVKRYDSLSDMKADEYRYWKRRTKAARLAAVSEISAEAYGLEVGQSNVSRLQGPLIQLKRT